MIPSDNCLTAINKFPTVAKGKVKMNGGQRILIQNPSSSSTPSLSQKKTIKVNYILISHPSSRLDGDPSEEETKALNGST